MRSLLALESLLIATAIGAVLILVAQLLQRLGRHWSGHLRHVVLLSAVVAGLGTLGLLGARSSDAQRCLLAWCTPRAEASGRNARAHEYYSTGAAAKFPDLAPGPAQAPAVARHAGLARTLLMVWLIGFAIAMRGVLRRSLLARRIVREARPLTTSPLGHRVRTLARHVGVTGRVRVAEHPDIAIPAVAGVLRPTLLLPPGFSSEPAATIDVVLLHELAHVQRHDGLASALAELARACFWFDPFMRAATRRLRDLQEIAADSFVLDRGIHASTYAEILLGAYRRAVHVPGGLTVAHAIVGDCQIETRLRSILDPATAHAAPRPLLAGAVGVGFLGAALAMATSASALQSSGGSGAAQPTTIERRLLTPSALDSIVRPVFINRMADRYVAGAAIAVVHEGRLIYRQGFGRREVFHEVPVDPERTIFRIGSITKVLTGVAVMQLVDRGLLDLDADVNTYLTEFRVASSFREPVRVRHLLTHTAGFDQIGLDRHARSAAEVLPLGEFLSRNLIRIRAPEEFTTYDTYAITLAGYLVERVSGLPYEEYLRRNILAPLAMHRSGITVPPALAGDVAVGYGFAGTWEAEPWEFMNTAPASSVNATVTDMARFAAMLLEGGRLGGARVLSARSARAMMTQQFTNDADQPGYGFTLFEDRSFGIPAFSHGGSMAGFGTFLYLLPEARLGIFIATNQESGTVANAVVGTLVDALFPGHGPAAAPRPRLARSPDLARFVGRYANSMHHHTNPDTGWRRRPFELALDSAGHLAFDGAPAYAVGPLTFQRDDGVLLSFHETARGDIDRFVVNQSVFERLP